MALAVLIRRQTGGDPEAVGAGGIVLGGYMEGKFFLDI